MENCISGGEIDVMSGLVGAEVGGADTLLDLLKGTCLLGDFESGTGDESEGVCDLLRSAGLSTASSSGSLSRSWLDPPLAELCLDTME